MRDKDLELIQRFEQTFPVQEWRVHGIHIWPRIRIALGGKLDARAAASSAPQAPASRSGLQQILDLRTTLRARAQDRAHAANLGQPADVLFLTHPTCRQRVSGLWYDMFCDPLADLLEREGRKTLSLEVSTQPARYFVPRYRASALIQTEVVAAEIRGFIARKLGWSVAPSALTGYDELQAELRALGLPNCAPPVANLESQALFLHFLASYFRRVIERVQPKLVASVNYAGSYGMALNLAAHRSGVRSIDIQHGVMRRHSAYDGWTRLPADGYELLPDHFWCWSAADAAVIRAWPDTTRTRHTAVIGGQPWTCLWSDPDSALTRQMLAHVDEIKARSGGDRTVLLTLQWDAGLTELMQRMIESAPASWRFWIRLHPAMVTERAGIQAWVDAHAKDRCLVDEPTDLPLPVLLRRADVHCTRFSTTVQEAAAAGVASVVLDHSALELFRPETDAGWLTFASTPADAVAALGKPSRRASFDADAAPLGSVQTMQRALSQLLGSSA
jgi:hypothetical protein